MDIKPFMQDGVPTIEVTDVAELQGLTLIDVRGADEFTGELKHIPGAQLKTLGSDLTAYLQTADKNKVHIMICRSGARSSRATMEAINLGFERVYNLAGGMLRWKERGLPSV